MESYVKLGFLQLVRSISISITLFFFFSNQDPMSCHYYIYSCNLSNDSLIVAMVLQRLTGMLMMIFSKCMNLALKWIGIETSI